MWKTVLLVLAGVLAGMVLAGAGLTALFLGMAVVPAPAGMQVVPASPSAAQADPQEAPTHRIEPLRVEAPPSEGR